MFFSLPLVVVALNASAEQQARKKAPIYKQASPTSKGRKTVFKDNSNGQKETHVTNTKTPGQKSFPNKAKPLLFVPPLDGNEKIVFCSGRDGNAEIYRMDADGGHQTRLTANNAEDMVASFSTDRSKIAFHSDRSGEREIYVMSANGDKPTRLTTQGGETPCFSRDGQKICYKAYREGIPHIFIMNADGTNQVQLTKSKYEDYTPCFTPDGKKIAFSSCRSGNPEIFEIYIMNLDGTQITRLTNRHSFSTTPSFSADGKKLAFSSRVGQPGNANYEIFVMSADGSDMSRITHNEFKDNYPFFSPDGKKIAFASVRGQLAQLYMMNSDGSHEIQLTKDTEGGNFGQSWVPAAK